MIQAKIVFPKVRRPDDESGKIYTPILNIELREKPNVGELFVFDPDTILTMVTPGVANKVERFGDVYPQAPGFDIESVVHKWEKIHSIRIYLKNRV